MYKNEIRGGSCDWVWEILRICRWVKFQVIEYEGEKAWAEEEISKNKDLFIPKQSSFVE